MINTLLWWHWLLLLSIPPAIILLYFLKLKRQPVEVPSTYLWSRTIEDLHVNTIWQRLRQSLLLFLQLLLVGLIILSLLRPGWQSTALVGDRFVFMIDASASMSSTDTGKSRLEIAKEQARNYISQMRSGDVAMVISFSDTAIIEQEFTDKRKDLEQAVARIKQTSRPSDLKEALQAASGLANPSYTRLEDGQVVDEGLPTTLYILSDGGFTYVPEFSLGKLQPIHVRIGAESPDNVGVVAFSSDRNPEKPDRLQAFARLENYGDVPQPVTIELLLDGEMIDASDVTVPAEGSVGASFDLPDLQEGQLELRIDRKDDFEADNRAFAAVNRSRPVRVLLVTNGNEALELALQTEEASKLAKIAKVDVAFLQSEDYQRQALTGEYDLIIYDRCAPTQMPQSNTFFVGSVPPQEGWLADPRKPAPLIIDIDQAHPLMQLINMDNVLLVSGFSIRPPAGGTVLMESVNGPLLSIAPRLAFEDLVLGCEMQPYRINEQGQEEPNTNWPIRRSFPTFLINVVTYLGGSQSATAALNLRPGEPAFLRTALPVPQITVKNPSNQQQRIERDNQGTFVYVGTDQLGVYQILEGNADSVSNRFSVNLFDSQESNITPRNIEIGYQEVETQTAVEPKRQELWKLILLVAILVVLFEWYVYNRRVYL